MNKEFFVGTRRDVFFVEGMVEIESKELYKL